MLWHGHCYCHCMRLRKISEGQRGFSLIEVLIAMAIVAIMAAVAIPFFGGFIDNRNLKSAARDIAGDIFEYRERAIAENRIYQITFNQAGNSYTVRQCTDTALPCAGTDFPAKSPGAFGSGITIVAGVNFNGGSVLQLLPRGIAMPVTGGNLSVRNSRTSTATISVGLTGRTNVDWTGTLH